MADDDGREPEMEPSEAEVIEAKEIELAALPPSTLFGTREPKAIIADATTKAMALADVIRKQKLTTRINNKDHVQIEGWTLLGSMLGVFASEVWSRPYPADWEAQGLARPKWWEAKVEAVTMSGSVVGSATGMCSRDEKTWSGRDDYALRSMAITRAASKALRMPLGFVMVLAGFEATPEEEMSAEFTRAEQAKAQPGSGGRKATQPQIKKLAVIAGEQGWDDDERRKRAGVASFTDLTMRSASELIEEWAKLPVPDVVEGEVVDEGGDSPATAAVEGPHAVSESEPSGVDKPAGSDAGVTLELWEKLTKFTGSEDAAVKAVEVAGFGTDATPDELRSVITALLRDGREEGR